MWPIAGSPDGSSYFDNQPNMLDRLLVNKSMTTGNARIKWTQPQCRSSDRRPWSVRVSTPKPIPLGRIFLHPPIELAGSRPRGRLHPDRRMDFSAVCVSTLLQLAIAEIHI